MFGPGSINPKSPESQRIYIMTIKETLAQELQITYKSDRA